MQRYWKNETRSFARNSPDLNFIIIPDNYKVHDWFKFYREWKKVLKIVQMGKHLKAYHPYRDQDTKNNGDHDDT